MKRMSEEEYVNNGGNLCPVCESDTTQTGEKAFETVVLFWEMDCFNCGANWDERYELVGYHINEPIKEEEEESPPPAFHIGMRFSQEGGDEEYLLAQVEKNKVALVGLNQGNRFNDPVEVCMPHHITPDEWERITSDDEFTLIE